MDKLQRPRAEVVEFAAPNPWWAFAVGLVYVFRTPRGRRLMRELEAAIRRYAADPAALLRLMRGEEIIEAEVIEMPQKRLP